MEDERKTFNQMIERSHENKDTNIFSYIFGNYQTTVQDFVFYFIIIQFEDPILIRWNESSLLEIEVKKLLVVEKLIESCNIEQVISYFVSIDEDIVEYLINALQKELGIDTNIFLIIIKLFNII